MSFPFSAAVGGVRRYIRHIILFCVAIVMVGTMVLTTYTASADSSTAIPLEYNAESRAKAKAYYAALVFCISETDGYGSDDLPVVSAVNGRWGRSDSSDTGDNFTDDFLSRMRGTERTVDCAKGNLIADAINYFASMNDSSIKPWNEWTLEDKRGLFCDVFYISDGSHSYKDECSDIFDNIFEYLNDDFAKYVFMPREGDEYDNGKHWHTRLNTFLNNRIIMGSGNNIEQPYENDEKFYVYDAIASNWCIGANNWGTKQLIAGDFIRGIRLEMDKNALKIVPKWAIVEHTSRNAEWLETEANSNGIGEKEIDCYEDNESGLNSLMNDPVDGVVVAAINTRVEYLRRDCKKAYVDFYNTQRDYRNTLIGDDLTEVQTEYIAWFDGLTEPRNWILDTNSCVDNWPDPSWPANPTEWSNITIFECKIEEYIHELLSTNPDPDSPDWTGYTIPDLPSDDYDNTSSDTRTDPCYQSAGALGWAICPIMSGLSNTLTSIYEDMVEPFLAVNPRLLGAEAKKVVDDVTVFANAAIIIFLLMVIFSQLTGVGIDNYGIKKSLPKLIVTAILVNLSFVICQVAVDLSNIVGSGANSMLSGVDVSITTCNDAEGGVSNGVGLNVPGGRQCVPADISSGSEAGMFKTMINVASVGLAGIGVGSIALGIASSGWLAGLIIPIFLLLITAVIAVLFFFVLLGVRQAGVVILAVLSPLALACYMLPNTKRFFDKWKKAFTGLLVLYPICGLLIGGGQLAAKILISASQDYVTYFAGCLIMVVPFFFIPSLLKGSFAAMGNIGAKISGFGKSLGSRGRGRVEGAIKNSDRYKNRVKYNQDRAAFRRANRTMNRIKRRGGGNEENLSKRQQERLRTAQDAAIAYRRRETENERRSGKDYYEAAMAAEEADRVDKETSQRLSLMKSGGIGPENERKPYTFQNLEDRITRLRDDAATRELNSDEQIELAALARGLSSMSGGGGVLSKMVRGGNTNFMRAFAQVYSQDSIVQKKLNEKDAGASVYTEQFMRVGGQEGSQFNAAFGNYSGTKDYRNAVDKRVKSYAAGLNQSGAALTDYINGLSQQDCQNIINDDTLLNSLDRSTRQQFERSVADRWPDMTQTPRTVNLANVPPANNGGGNTGSTDFNVPRGGNGGNGNGGGGGAEPQPGPQPQPQPQPRSQSGSEGGGRIIISDNPNADWDALRGGRR